MPTRTQTHHFIILLGGFAITLIATATGLGIYFDIRALSAMAPNGSPIALSTTICLLMLGLATVAVGLQQRAVAIVLGSILLLLGTIVVVAQASGQQHELHAWLKGTVLPSTVTGVTRMSRTNAVLIVLAGAAVLELCRQRSRRVALAVLGAALFGVSTSRLLGYATSFSDSFDWGRALGMAFPTALVFFLFGLLLLDLTRRLGERPNWILSLSASAVALLLATGLVMGMVNRELIRAASVVKQSLEVQATMARCTAAIAQVEAAARSYALSGDTSFLERQAADQAALLRQLADLENLLASDPEQLARLRELQPLVAQKIAFNEQLARARRLRDIDRAAAIMATENPAIGRRLTELFNALHREQELLLEVRKQRSESLARNAYLVMMSGCVLAIGLVAAAFRLTAHARRESEQAQEELEQRVVERTAELTRSERKAREAQDRLETVLNNSPILLWSVDRHGLFTAVAGRTLKEQGFSPEQLLGTSVFDLLRNEPATIDLTRRALAAEISAAEAQFDGHWYENYYGTTRDAHGAITGLVCVSTDITSRKEAERLALSERTAQEASRLKSAFLANMSHEIRTPMNGVIGMSTLLRQTPLRSDQREMTDVIQSSAENLLTIIDDILDFSKIEAGKLKIEPVPTDLRQTIEETLTALAPRAHQKRLELVNDFADDVPSALRCDGGRIRQIVTNLVGNAIKFTDCGQVVVRTRCLATEAGSARIRIEVQDSGIGISREAQGKLFHAFAQADESIARRFGGSGLGLAISRQLVELMHGAIGIESEEGKGSTFWLEVALPTLGERGSAELEPRQHLNALVVDDCAASAAVVARQIRQMGGRADVVTNGGEALALLQRQGGAAYDAVLIDDEMPEMSGMKLAELVRAESALADVSLVLLSSNGPIFDASDPELRLFCAVLAKPVRLAQLRRSLRTLLTSDPECADANSAVPQVVPGAGARPLRILLAEDDRVNQRVATGMLKALGHRVELAVNGAEAVAKCAAAEFDAVLIDCNMPVLDGWGATRQIREREAREGRRRLPIVALTASAMTHDRLTCLEAGMDDFVSKPILLDQLRAVLLRHTAKMAGATSSDGAGLSGEVHRL